MPAAFVTTAPIFFLMGLRQRRDGGGAWTRLIGVSLALAGLQTIPVLVGVLLWRLSVHGGPYRAVA